MTLPQNVQFLGLQVISKGIQYLIIDHGQIMISDSELLGLTYLYQEKFDLCSDSFLIFIHICLSK